MGQQYFIGVAVGPVCHGNYLGDEVARKRNQPLEEGASDETSLGVLIIDGSLFWTRICQVHLPGAFKVADRLFHERVKILVQKLSRRRL